MPRRAHLTSDFRRPSPARVAGVVASGTVLAAALAGCGGGLPDRDLSAAQRQACADLMAGLPETVADQGGREVSAEDAVASWGDPAIVLRCAVGTPEGFDRFSTCQRANGIDWFVPESQIEDQRADVRMTTIGRDPAVEVFLPARYRPPVAAMVDLTAAIKAHTTETTPCT